MPHLIASFFVGLSFNSWRMGLAALIAIIVAGLFARLRYLHTALVCSGLLLVLWNFGGSFIKYFMKAQGLLETGYILLIGFFFTGVILTSFGALLGLKSSINGSGNVDSFRDDRQRQAAEPLNSRIEVETDVSEFDPYSVLSVEKTAGADEIKAAYRRQMGLYHPDKVEHLGAELQEVARRRVLDIQRAFEMLT